MQGNLGYQVANVLQRKWATPFPDTTLLEMVQQPCQMGKPEQRARAFFRGGIPFTTLDKGYKKHLEILLYIRNAIAHRSSYAKGKFEQEVIGSLPLTPRERTPAGFLRSRFRITPVQTRYEFTFEKTNDRWQVASARKAR